MTDPAIKMMERRRRQSDGLRRVLVISRHGRLRSIVQQALMADEAGSDRGHASDRPSWSVLRGELNYEVDTAARGTEALTLVGRAAKRNGAYQVVFVELGNPPEWDGADAILRLWQMYPNLQVVLCNAAPEFTFEDVMQKFGPRANLTILSDPFNPAQIQQAAFVASQRALADAQTQQQISHLQQANEQLIRTNDYLERQIAERMWTEQELRHMALHDQLTQLPNRTMLVEQIDHCIQMHNRSPETKFAVMFMDLDNFKLVNDNFGHREGDQLLIDVAHRLTACFRTMHTKWDKEPELAFDETVGRIGGDEFIILLENVVDLQTPNRVAEAICEVMRQSFDVGGQKWQVGFSIGITTSEFKYGDAIEVLRDADTALYESKSFKRGGYLCFNDSMRQSAISRLLIETDLRRAYQAREFRMQYQPIISLQSGQLKGFEALIRWHHPERGMISPLMFMPVAEETGLIVEIGEWVLDEAIGQLGRWRKESAEGAWATMSINVSARQFLNGPRLMKAIENALSKHDVPANRINLEITESLMMESLDQTEELLYRIREMGIGIHLDDFGTGYSSLSYLHKIPMTGIKIDRSFVQLLSEETSSIATIDAIRTIGTHRGIHVIVEGVETPDQLASIISLGCDYAQGYLLSRPVDPEEAAVMMRGHEPWLQMKNLRIRPDDISLADSA